MYYGTWRSWAVSQMLVELILSPMSTQVLQFQAGELWFSGYRMLRTSPPPTLSTTAAKGRSEEIPLDLSTFFRPQSSQQFNWLYLCIWVKTWKSCFSVFCKMKIISEGCTSANTVKAFTSCEQLWALSPVCLSRTPGHLALALRISDELFYKHYLFLKKESLDFYFPASVCWATTASLFWFPRGFASVQSSEWGKYLQWQELLPGHWCLESSWSTRVPVNLHVEKKQSWIQPKVQPCRPLEVIGVHCIAMSYSWEIQSLWRMLAWEM